MANLVLETTNDEFTPCLFKDSIPKAERQLRAAYWIADTFIVNLFLAAVFEGYER